MMRAAARVSIAILACTTARSVGAQQSPAIPDAPAFTYLNATPATIARPTSARDLVIGLTDGIDSIGRVQRGLAIDFTPWVILPGRMTNERYRTSRGAFILGNLQASLATVQTAGDSASTDLAFALRTNIWNRSDPLTDVVLAREMSTVVSRCIADATNRTTGVPSDSRIEQCADSSLSRLTTEWLDAGHWNDFGLAVAAAYGARFRESRFDRLAGRGTAVWSTISVPIGRSLGQFLVQTRGDWVRGSEPEGDTALFSAGARIVFGAARVNGFGELVRSWADKGADRSTGRWSAGVEYRAAEDVWISAGFGATYNNTATRNHTLLIASLRWNVSDAAQFAPQ